MTSPTERTAHERADRRAARTLAAVLAVIAGTGLAGSLLPDARTTITTTMLALAALALLARVAWWQITEHHADRADAIAAATARLAYAARHGADGRPGQRPELRGVA